MTDSEKGEAVEQIRSGSEPKISNVKLAEKLGVGESSVRRWLQAAGYPEEVKQMTKDGTVADKSLRPIADLSTPQEQVKTAEYIRDNELNYRQAKETVEVIKALPVSIREKLTEEPSAFCAIGILYGISVAFFLFSKAWSRDDFPFQ
ncbi:hypothetical protein M7775_07910 [Sporomusa sphaeroides DSM 2875]|uniref:hypothetical protein n=1 Tax=Sporomusa sphaeroides TaxID=47679 RepID=UPI00202FF601|nr:hypothetical protein [Sporomusa sphaeroides]MCM0758494.1 hypothetical protein [Sporomusa sphaeroides DSM 2875]